MALEPLPGNGEGQGWGGFSALRRPHPGSLRSPTLPVTGEGIHC